MKKIVWLLCMLIGLAISTTAIAEKKSEKVDEISFQFFVNPIAGPEEAFLEIFLINEGTNTLEFEAPTSQWYDITITNQKNEIVYDYSKGRAFLQAFQKIILNPGETQVWMERIYGPSGKHLAPGEYKINAKLKATTINGERITGYHVLMDEAVMTVPPENPIIKNVRINKNDNNMVVSGMARPVSGELYYIVEDGHHEWISETKVKRDFHHPNWSEFSFEFKIQKEKYPDSLPYILYIYEKDDKGTIIHSYPKLLKSQ